MHSDPLAHPDVLIRRVYAYVAYRVGPGSDAEDITSETMLRAVRYRKGYDPARGKPLTWLIGIARGCIADHLAGIVPTSDDQELASSQNVENEVLERLVLRDAVASLDEREQELIALRYGADLSTKQIAVLMEMTPSAIDVALHRARARLKACLAGEISEPDAGALRRPSPEPGT
jgi:RNA polymerase sigma-70 factor (ECF subfamily)